MLEMGSLVDSMCGRLNLHASVNSVALKTAKGFIKNEIGTGRKVGTKAATAVYMALKELKLDTVDSL